MEPARDGRDDKPRNVNGDEMFWLPQWSPPVTGGTTVVRRGESVLAGLAAMEPARDGRDDNGSNQ